MQEIILVVSKPKYCTVFNEKLRRVNLSSKT